MKERQKNWDEDEDCKIQSINRKKTGALSAAAAEGKVPQIGQINSHASEATALSRKYSAHG